MVNNLPVSIEFVIPAIAWFVAQLIKCIIYLVVHKEVNLHMVVASGGMPSSHSATVCALATTVAFDCGINSALFGISCIMAIIVMYDAMGVRLETGNQSKVINNMLQLFEDMGKPISVERKFKELVGHTPLQVLMGALLGIVVGWIMMHI